VDGEGDGGGRAAVGLGEGGVSRSEGGGGGEGRATAGASIFLLYLDKRTYTDAAAAAEPAVPARECAQRVQAGAWGGGGHALGGGGAAGGRCVWVAVDGGAVGKVLPAIDLQVYGSCGADVC
jgi:hypothetical protein